MAETWLATARFTTANCQRQHAITIPSFMQSPEATQMAKNELRELENSRRIALWALASLYPSDTKAFIPLAILHHFDTQEQSSTSS